MRLIKQISKSQVLILDDWGVSPMNDGYRRDLPEILDDRHQYSSTIVTSQLPLKYWHDFIGDPTLADAILDRLIHNSHKIELKGESMRKKKSTLKDKEEEKKSSQMEQSPKEGGDKWSK